MNKAPRSPSDSDSRDARLKAALRANLARRKAQARARATGDEAQAQGPDETGENEDGHGQHHRQG